VWETADDESVGVGKHFQAVLNEGGVVQRGWGWGDASCVELFGEGVNGVLHQLESGVDDSLPHLDVVDANTVGVGLECDRGSVLNMGVELVLEVRGRGPWAPFGSLGSHSAPAVATYRATPYSSCHGDYSG
jgi:hypothetical protein